MPKRKKAWDKVSEAKMKQFGRLLQRLRGPDVGEYRHLMAVKRWKEVQQHERKRYDQSVMDPEVVRKDEEKREKKREEKIREYESEVGLPESLYEYHRSAMQLKLKMTSLREAARQLGVDKNTLHDYERGKRYPPAEFVFKFCEVFELSVEKLLRDWIGLHPDVAVRRYVDREFNYPNVWCKGIGLMEPSEEDAIEFIQSAVQFSSYVTGANVVFGRMLEKTALMTALVMYRTVERGLPIHSKYIDTYIYNYDSLREKYGYFADEED